MVPQSPYNGVGEQTQSTTPPFLLWALAVACPLRTVLADWQSPERTERHLRGAREFGRGLAEGRIVDGICLAAEAIADVLQPLSKARGFRVTDALEIVGGETAVRGNCPGCVANVAEPHYATTFAGCYGMLSLPTTFPGREEWYRQWVDAPLNTDIAARIAGSLASLAWPAAADDPEFQRLAVAVRHAAHDNQPLHTKIYPAGKVVGRLWILPPHCRRCGIEWSGGHCCVVCGGVGTQTSGLKRHVRGERPFLSLTRIVNSDVAGELLRKGRMREN